MRSLRLDTISFEDYQQWFEAEFANLHHRSPYHDPAWINAAARSVGFDLGFIGVYDAGDRVAAVPGFLARQGPFRLFGSPLRGALTSYLGPVVLDPRLIDEELPELVLRCQEHARREWQTSYARFTLRNEPANPVDLGFNWRAQRAPSYRLDLSPGAEAVWAGLKSDCRRNIRRAEREGIEIVPFDDPERYHRMLEATLGRHGAKSWQTARFFRSIMERVPRPDPLRCVGAAYHGEIIATGLFLHDDREVHFVSGASLPTFGSMPTSYLMHWHAISAGIDARLRVFNSDASGVQSIDQFKESFRPALERRCSLIWATPVVRRAERLFMRSRKLRKRLGARRLRSRSQRTRDS